jgi:hypothetical protein
MDHQMHLHIKHQLVMIISRPIRHLHPITVVDERAHIYTVHFFFVFVFPLFFFLCRSPLLSLLISLYRYDRYCVCVRVCVLFAK